ncbi:hypothetical protein ILUMI_04369, partial [Ignelater luminosus]
MYHLLKTFISIYSIIGANYKIRKFLLIRVIILSGAETNTALPRIIGGYDADIKDFPFQLSIILKVNRVADSFKGAAVIVSRHAALTSASNIAFVHGGLVRSGNLYLRGNTSKWLDDKDGCDHQIVRTTLHPKYTTISMDYNLAVIKVKEPFKAVFEKSIPVSKKHYRYRDDQTVTILGWGKTSINQKGPTAVLKYVDVKIINHQKCYDAYA